MSSRGLPIAVSNLIYLMRIEKIRTLKTEKLIQDHNIISLKLAGKHVLSQHHTANIKYSIQQSIRCNQKVFTTQKSLNFHAIFLFVHLIYADILWKPAQPNKSLEVQNLSNNEMS